jgi:predicted nucleotidyltransferase
MIQNNTGQFIQVPIEGITPKDEQAIHKLTAIIEHGNAITKPVYVTWTPLRKDLNSILDDASQSKPIQIKMSFDESYGELFGSKIQLGRMVRYITGMIEIPTAELEQAIATLPPDESLRIKLVDVEVNEIFPDWYIREAQRLSQCLVDDFGAESVYLFGSLAWSDIHAPETDIDLAVSGLPSERFLEAVGYLERASKFPVDLVNLESVPDHLRQRILAEGKKLNERAAVTAVSG